jgi:hypothetical protein
MLGLNAQFLVHSKSLHIFERCIREFDDDLRDVQFNFQDQVTNFFSIS